MDSVPAVDIDESGRFKYILIELTDRATKQTKLIVRGYERCPFHGKFEWVTCSAVRSIFQGIFTTKWHPASRVRA